MKLIRRWQAAKRQQQRRSRPEVRAQQAAAERERRARQREQQSQPTFLPAATAGAAELDLSLQPEGQPSSEPHGEPETQPDLQPGQEPESPPDREPEAEADVLPDGEPNRPEDGAWSRRRKNLGPFCDRPGCYDPVRPSCRCRARYCGDACRQAMRRVRDRERKWLQRNAPVGQFKRQLEYEAARRARGDPS